MDSAMADRVHLNLMRLNAWVGEVSNGAVQRHDGELLVASRSPLPFLNVALRERADAPAEEMIARAQRFFFERGRGFVVYCWPGDPEVERAAAAAGMTPVLERYPEMVCRGPLAQPHGDVRPVESAADAESYWAVCEGAYPSLGFPPGLFAEAFAPELLLEPESWACLGCEDGSPLACASLYVVDDVGFVGWVASLPQARGRGLAAACTVAATNRAFEQGLTLASLQASPMGAPLYPRLGYEELFDYRLLGMMPA
jgi:GNAT superfamily N-acetyltransferase